MAKKLTTEEILARARKSDAEGSAPADESKPAADAAPEDASAPADEAGTDAPAAPAATPKSTADILAAARASAAGGDKPAAEKPAAEKPKAAPAKPAGAPKSTADILAAARNQAAGGGESSKPAAKPAAKKAADKTSPKAPAESPGISVKEMLEAVRTPQSETGEAEQKPKLPPLPKKPLPKGKAKPAAKAADPAPRRGVLGALVVTPFALAWGLFTAVSAVMGLATARFMMPNVLVEPPTKFKIGAPGDFPPEAVISKFKAERGIWVVNTASYNGEQLIYALSSICTHLGCTPNWLEGEQKYKCPCHGSGFYINGINFEGPAPRPLERVGIRLAEDGMLEVDKSLKFQQEMGQWEDPASFVQV